MKISILIPIYNVEKYIQRCVESLLTQTDLEDVQIIFVNDNTSDKSISILENYLEQFPEIKKNSIIVSHEKNKGLAASRNTGLAYAKGEYIIFLDSDDTLREDTIEIVKNQISKTNPDIIVFGMQFVYSDGIKKTVGGNIVPNSKEDYIKAIINRNCLVTVCGKVYSKRLFKNISFIEGLNYGEDYATLPRLVYEANEILDLTHEILYNYYQDNTTAYTKSIINYNKIENIQKAVKVLDSYFSKTTIENLPIIRKQLKIRNKVFLLEYADTKFRSYILSLYPELNNQSISMPLKHRIVWFLARTGRNKQLAYYLQLSIWIKTKLHI